MTIRGDILEEAKVLTEGDRNETYGDPEDNMCVFSGLVYAYITGRMASSFGLSRLESFDGAVIAGLLKISRIAANPLHEDNYVDLAAYAAIAGECVKRGKPNDPRS